MLEDEVRRMVMKNVKGTHGYSGYIAAEIMIITKHFCFAVFDMTIQHPLW